MQKPNTWNATNQLLTQRIATLRFSIISCHCWKGLSCKINDRRDHKIFNCRWEAPVSVALYAPGNDFDATVRSILFLRNCHPQSALVQRFATFHVYFDAQFLPKKIQRSFDDVEKDFLCAELAKFPHEKTFKATNNLTYPVNVGRNLARTAALTHFVLASDIELYPNPGLVDDFFDMLQRDPDKQLSPDG